MISRRDCPTCGQSVDGMKGMRVDLNSNTALIDDKVILLTNREIEFLYALNNIYPRTIQPYSLIDVVYGAGYDKTPSLAIAHIYIHKLRNKLKPTSARIESVWGRGFRLRFDHQPTTTTGDTINDRPNRPKTQSAFSQDRTSHR